jgi:hypothetical protein
MCFGRGPTLMVDYGLSGVIWPMIGPLVAQIIAVYFLNVAGSHSKGSNRDRKIRGQ